MSEWSVSRTTAQALAELEAAKIPSAPLYSPQQALDDAHIRTAGLLRDTEYPGVTRGVPLAPTPVDLSETPGRFQRRAPTLGEHTDEILSELGYQKAQIAELRTRNVI
jgi:crotonobetainyl-CoA:carnitine CoA-transferase CaiB-like acyl-CoA transferase